MVWAMRHSAGDDYLIPSTSTLNDSLQYDAGNEQWKFNINGTTEFILGTIGFRVQNVWDTDNTGGSNVRVDSDGRIHRDSSTLRKKTAITDASDLADIQLAPIRYRKKGDPTAPFQHSYGAEDLIDQNPEFGYAPGGVVEDYYDRAVLAILGAKANRADDELAALRAEVAELRESLEQLALAA